MYLYVSCPSAKRAIKGLHGCRKMNFTVRAHGREAQNLNMLSKQLPRGDSKRNTLLLQSGGGPGPCGHPCSYAHGLSEPNCTACNRALRRIGQRSFAKRWPQERVLNCQEQVLTLNNILMRYLAWTVVLLIA